MSQGRKAKGILLVLTAASLWGISGSVAQYLFEQHHLRPEWLVDVRLLVAGLAMLLIVSVRSPGRIWRIWASPKDVLELLLFSLLGMLAVQYTYFAAIRHANAATATVLQYLAPALICCYLALRRRTMPTARELTAVALSFAGTLLLATHGRIGSLSMTPAALIWGIVSAIALAFYTLQPIRLLREWGSGTVVGWGMLLGGIALSFVQPPWRFSGDWNLSSGLGVGFIILFGTLIAFFCYMESLNILDASETSVLACLEPLTAALLGVLWLGSAFGPIDWLGALCIIGTVVLLSLSQSQARNKVMKRTRQEAAVLADPPLQARE
ncbi:DMT family transporter [Gorillibacterium timonense]|uniref:DMT family transporter n=1 Tax=Gorillibacterium timonense TaxID=1689269 RepID=UPI00071CFABD|nr:EamA family transporter [Gorillibacterium timonense]